MIGCRWRGATIDWGQCVWTCWHEQLLLDVTVCYSCYCSDFLLQHDALANSQVLFFPDRWLPGFEWLVCGVAGALAGWEGVFRCFALVNANGARLRCPIYLLSLWLICRLFCAWVGPFLFSLVSTFSFAGRLRLCRWRKVGQVARLEECVLHMPEWAAMSRSQFGVKFVVIVSTCFFGLLWTMVWLTGKECSHLYRPLRLGLAMLVVQSRFLRLWNCAIFERKIEVLACKNVWLIASDGRGTHDWAGRGTCDWV